MLLLVVWKKAEPCGHAHRSIAGRKLYDSFQHYIHIFTHYNQAKYIILSLFIYFFYLFPLILLCFITFFLLIFLISKGKGGRGCNLSPPPLNPPKFSLYPPPSHTISLMPRNSALKRQFGNPVQTSGHTLGGHAAFLSQLP